MTFTEHMAWHMALVTIVTPLFVLGIRGTRWNPVHRSPVLFSPLAACLIEFLVIWTWHLPPLHDAARHHGGAFAMEQASFAGAALYFWLSILGGPGVPGRQASGIIALVLTFAHMTMLGALVALAPRALYAHGDDALIDQQIGGAVMILAGTVAYPLVALWLSRTLVSPYRGSAA